MTLTDRICITEESPWEESKDVTEEAFCKTGDDLVLTINLSHAVNVENYKFRMYRGDPPISTDRFRVETYGNVVQLTLEHATKSDVGHYALIAKKLPRDNESERIFSRRVYMSVDEPSFIEDGEPPFFIRRLTDLSVKVGTRTRFLVEIRSSTDPKVSWHRNDQLIQIGPRFSFIHEGNFYCIDVAPVTIEDQGHWTCIAENCSGRSSCISHLNILVPKAYKRPEFMSGLCALLMESGTVSLECKVIGVPTPILKWFKDGKEIKAGDIFALTANPEDPTSLGTYTCEAVNCMGIAYSSSRVHVAGKGSREGSLKPADALIITGDPPNFKTVLKNISCKIGESIILSCQVEVPPWPKEITWYNKRGRIEVNDRYKIMEDGLGGYSIRVNPIEAVDEGEWKCVANSMDNIKQFTSCLIAITIPKNYRKPRFMDSLKAILTEEGLVSFECKVVGFPTPLLRWFKDGQELKPGDVYQLTGTNSLGSYCCIAKNCMGEAKSTAELTVEDIQNQLNEEERLQFLTTNQPPKFIKTLRSSEAKINENFKFSVQVNIMSEPNLIWYRDNYLIENGERYLVKKESFGICHLEIQKLEFCDQAEWKCVASNDFGYSITSCFLKLSIPKHYKKPKFLENLRAILLDGNSVNLECKVIGVPQPILKWYKDGEELKPGDIHRIISGQDGTCCLGTYTCEAINCMGTVSSSASLLGFEDHIDLTSRCDPSTLIVSSIEHEHEIARNLSLSTIHEERTSQLLDSVKTDHSIILDDRGEISFSLDGKEVLVSLYETPDLTDEEALKVVEMYADQLSEHITEHNIVELPPMRFMKETSTSGNLLVEAVVIDISPHYFNNEEYDLRTEADIEDISIIDGISLSLPSANETVNESNTPMRPARRKSETISSKIQGQEDSESYHSAKESSTSLIKKKDMFDIEMDTDSEVFTDIISNLKIENNVIDTEKRKLKNETIKDSFSFETNNTSLNSMIETNIKHKDSENKIEKKQRFVEKSIFQKTSKTESQISKNILTTNLCIPFSEEDSFLNDKDKLINLLRQISEPVLIIREALVVTNYYIQDNLFFNGFINDKIVIPIQNICELMTEIEKKTLKNTNEKSLVQIIRISILENIGGPTEELLRGIELIGHQENKNDIHITLSILDSLVEPIDEITFVLSKFEYELSGQNIVEIPIIFERMKRTTNRLKFTLQNENIKMGSSVVKPLQKLHEILYSYLNSIILNKYGEWAENIDAVLVETLAKPLEDLELSLQHIQENYSQNISEQTIKMSDVFNEILSCLDSLIIALEDGVNNYRRNFVINLKNSLVAAAEEFSKSANESINDNRDNIPINISKNILNSLVDIQKDIDNTLHEIRNYNEQNTFKATASEYLNLEKLREIVSNIINKITELCENEIIEELIYLKEPLFNLKQSVSYHELTKKILYNQNIIHLLDSLQKMICTVISYVKTKESMNAYQIVIISIYTIIEEIKERILENTRKQSHRKIIFLKKIDTQINCTNQQIINNLKIFPQINKIHLELSTILDKYLKTAKNIESDILFKISRLRNSVGTTVTDIDRSSINGQQNMESVVQHLLNLEQPLIKLKNTFDNVNNRIKEQGMIFDVLKSLENLKTIFKSLQNVFDITDIESVIQLIDDIKKNIRFCMDINQSYKQEIKSKYEINFNIESENNDFQQNNESEKSKSIFLNETISKKSHELVSIIETSILPQQVSKLTEVLENLGQAILIVQSNITLIHLELYNKHSELFCSKSCETGKRFLILLKELLKPILEIRDVMQTQNYSTSELLLLNHLYEPIWILEQSILQVLEDKSFITENNKRESFMGLNSLIHALEDIQNQIPITLHKANIYEEILLIIQNIFEPFEVIQKRISEISSDTLKNDNFELDVSNTLNKTIEKLKDDLNQLFYQLSVIEDQDKNNRHILLMLQFLIEPLVELQSSLSVFKNSKKMSVVAADLLDERQNIILRAVEEIRLSIKTICNKISELESPLKHVIIASLKAFDCGMSAVQNKISKRKYIQPQRCLRNLYSRSITSLQRLKENIVLIEKNMNREILKHILEPLEILLKQIELTNLQFSESSKLTLDKEIIIEGFLYPLNYLLSSLETIDQTENLFYSKNDKDLLQDLKKCISYFSSVLLTLKTELIYGGVNEKASIIETITVVLILFNNITDVIFKICESTNTNLLVIEENYAQEEKAIHINNEYSTVLTTVDTFVDEFIEVSKRETETLTTLKFATVEIIKENENESIDFTNEFIRKISTKCNKVARDNSNQISFEQLLQPSIINLSNLQNITNKNLPNSAIKTFKIISDLIEKPDNKRDMWSLIKGFLINIQKNISLIIETPSHIFDKNKEKVENNEDNIIYEYLTDLQKSIIFMQQIASINLEKTIHSSESSIPSLENLTLSLEILDEYLFTIAGKSIIQEKILDIDGTSETTSSVNFLPTLIIPLKKLKDYFELIIQVYVTYNENLIELNNKRKTSYPRNAEDTDIQKQSNYGNENYDVLNKTNELVHYSDEEFNEKLLLNSIIETTQNLKIYLPTQQKPINNNNLIQNYTLKQMVISDKFQTKQDLTIALQESTQKDIELLNTYQNKDIKPMKKLKKNITESIVNITNHNRLIKINDQMNEEVLERKENEKMIHSKQEHQDEKREESSEKKQEDIREVKNILGTKNEEWNREKSEKVHLINEKRGEQEIKHFRKKEEIHQLLEEDNKENVQSENILQERKNMNLKNNETKTIDNTKKDEDHAEFVNLEEDHLQLNKEKFKQHECEALLLLEGNTILYIEEEQCEIENKQMNQVEKILQMKNEEQNCEDGGIAQPTDDEYEKQKEKTIINVEEACSQLKKDKNFINKEEHKQQESEYINIKNKEPIITDEKKIREDQEPYIKLQKCNHLITKEEHQPQACNDLILLEEKDMNEKANDRLVKEQVYTGQVDENQRIGEVLKYEASNESNLNVEEHGKQKENPLRKMAEKNKRWGKYKTPMDGKEFRQQETDNITVGSEEHQSLQEDNSHIYQDEYKKLEKDKLYMNEEVLERKENEKMIHSKQEHQDEKLEESCEKEQEDIKEVKNILGTKNEEWNREKSEKVHLINEKRGEQEIKHFRKKEEIHQWLEEDNKENVQSENILQERKNMNLKNNETKTIDNIKEDEDHAEFVNLEEDHLQLNKEKFKQHECEALLLLEGNTILYIEEEQCEIENKQMNQVEKILQMKNEEQNCEDGGIAQPTDDEYEKQKEKTILNVEEACSQLKKDKNFINKEEHKQQESEYINIKNKEPIITDEKKIREDQEPYIKLQKCNHLITKEEHQPQACNDLILLEEKDMNEKANDRLVKEQVYTGQVDENQRIGEVLKYEASNESNLNVEEHGKQEENPLRKMAEKNKRWGKYKTPMDGKEFRQQETDNITVGSEEHQSLQEDNSHIYQDEYKKLEKDKLYMNEEVLERKENEKMIHSKQEHQDEKLEESCEKEQEDIKEVKNILGTKNEEWNREKSEKVHLINEKRGEQEMKHFRKKEEIHQWLEEDNNQTVSCIESKDKDCENQMKKTLVNVKGSYHKFKEDNEQIIEKKYKQQESKVVNVENKEHKSIHQKKVDEDQMKYKKLEEKHVYMNEKKLEQLEYKEFLILNGKYTDKKEKLSEKMNKYTNKVEEKKIPINNEHDECQEMQSKDDGHEKEKEKLILKLEESSQYLEKDNIYMIKINYEEQERKNINIENSNLTFPVIEKLVKDRAEIENIGDDKLRRIEHEFIQKGSEELLFWDVKHENEKTEVLCKDMEEHVIKVQENLQMMNAVQDPEICENVQLKNDERGQQKENNFQREKNAYQMLEEDNKGIEKKCKDHGNDNIKMDKKEYKISKEEKSRKDEEKFIMLEEDKCRLNEELSLNAFNKLLLSEKKQKRENENESLTKDQEYMRQVEKNLRIIDEKRNHDEFEKMKLKDEEYENQYEKIIREGEKVYPVFKEGYKQMHKIKNKYLETNELMMEKEKQKNQIDDKFSLIKVEEYNRENNKKLHKIVDKSKYRKAEKLIRGELKKQNENIQKQREESKYYKDEMLIVMKEEEEKNYEKYIAQRKGRKYKKLEMEKIQIGENENKNDILKKEKNKICVKKFDLKNNYEIVKECHNDNKTRIKSFNGGQYDVQEILKLKHLEKDKINFINLTPFNFEISKHDQSIYKDNQYFTKNDIHESKNKTYSSLCVNTRQSLEFPVHTSKLLYSKNYSISVADCLSLRHCRRKFLSRNPNIIYQGSSGSQTILKKKLLNRGKCPIFCMKLTNYTVAEGSHIRLICTAIGEPEPQVYWTKNGDRVRAGGQVQTKYKNGISTLEITSAVLEDSGYYVCLAKNSNGYSSTEATVRVYPIYKVSSLESSFPSLKNYTEAYNFGQTTSLCLNDERILRENNFTSPSLNHGFRNYGEQKDSISSFKSHTIADLGFHKLTVAEAMESGVRSYIFRVSSDYGHIDMSPSEIISLRKIDNFGRPAKFVSKPDKKFLCAIDGEPVSISFRISGIPKPKVIWMKGIKDISDGPRSHKEIIDDYVRLTLNRIKSEDEGTYCILVKNSYGCDRWFFTLKVKKRARSLTRMEERLSLSNRLSDIHIREQQSYLRNVPGCISSEPFVINGGKNWLSLSWGKAEPRGPAPVVAYKIDAWKVGRDGGARWIELGISPINSFDVFNLQPGIEYKFRVTPKNRYGWGESVTMKDSVMVTDNDEIPEFTKILPGQLKALEGSTTELKCEVRHNSKFNIKWLRETAEIESGNNSKYIIKNDKTKFSLIIKNINESDSGRYVCEVSNKAGKVSSYGRILVVNDSKILNADTRLRKRLLQGLVEDGSPQFIMRLRDRRVQTSYPVRLTCQVIGCPEPEVTWLKDEKVVTENSSRSIYIDESHFYTLEITRASLEDTGFYTACAKNTNGSVSCQCILVVDKGIQAYVAPHFLYELGVAQAVKVDSDLRLITQIEAYPSVGVTWHRDGIRLRHCRRAVMTLNHDGIAELILAKIRNRDAGVYTCTATNEVGKAETSTKIFVVDSYDSNITEDDYSPQVIMNPPNMDLPYSKVPLFVTKPLSNDAREGDTVIIQCEVVGDPKPEVFWLRDFLKPEYYRDAVYFRVIGAGPQYCLEIPHAKLEYTGTYSVLAKNEHGEAKTVISLQIYAKGPEQNGSMDRKSIRQGNVLSIPLIKSELKDIRCSDGDAVTLECKVYAPSEPPIIRWEKSGKVLSMGGDFSAEFDGESAKLIIHHVYLEDEGEYVCVASNELGKAFTSACLVVDVPEGKENIISQPLLMKPQNLFSGNSTPKSTPRSTPARSLSPGASCGGRELRTLSLPRRIDAGCSSRKPKICPPKFYSIPHNRVAEEGETVRFQCAIAGHPRPWYCWDKNGINVTSNSRISLKEKDDVKTLEIRDVTLEDAGLYRVILENDVGRTEASARLEIINRNKLIVLSIRTRKASPRTYPTISKSLLYTPTRLNKRLQLQCDVRGSPSPNITRYRNETRLECSTRIKKSVMSQKAVLEISNVKYNDAGEYACEAQNLFGSIKSSCKIDVLNINDPSMKDQEPPIFLQTIPCNRIVMEGNAYELQARLSGTPPFTVFWFKNGYEVINTDYHQHIIYEDGGVALRFLNVCPLDAGDYICFVKNEYGEASCRGLFTVQNYKKTSSELILNFVKKSVPVLVEKSEMAYFCSRIQSNHSVEFDWIIDGKSTRENDRYKVERHGLTSILRIKNVTKYDCRVIRCTASITRGPSISFSTQLRLKPISCIKLHDNIIKCLELKLHNVKRINSSFPMSNELSTLNLSMNKSSVKPKKRMLNFSRLTINTRDFTTESRCEKCVKKIRRNLAKKNIKEEKIIYKTLSYRKKSSMKCVTKKFNSKSIPVVEIHLQDFRKIHSITEKLKKIEISVNIKFDIYKIDKTTIQVIPIKNLINPLNLNLSQEQIRGMNNRNFPKIISSTNGINKNRLSIKSISSFKNLKYNAAFESINNNMKIYQNIRSNNNSNNNNEEEQAKEIKKVVNRNRQSVPGAVISFAEYDQMTPFIKQQRGILLKRKEVPAVVLRPPVDVNTLKGSTIVLEAIYQGYPDPSVKWMRAGRELLNEERTQIDIGDGFSRLTIIEIIADQAGKYAVSVENSFGSDCRFASVAVEGPPEACTESPVVTSKCRGLQSYRANVTWCSPAYDGGCALSGYILECRCIDELHWHIITQNCHSLRYEVTELQIGVTYLFRVRALNIHGPGEPSPESRPFKIPCLDMNDAEHKLMVEEEEEEETDAENYKIVIPVEGHLFKEIYEIHEELGKGRYGLVKRVMERKTKKSFAAKFVKIIKISDQKQVREEIKIMNMLRHPKLLRLTAAFENLKEIIMITEYISGGELFERVVADDFTLTEKDSILFMRQICEGVKYMHENNIVHLDLKPENIMCHTRTSHRIKLIDFGLAQLLTPNKSVRVLFGTPEFIPPEIINYEPIGTESDMWSVGVICYVLLTGLSPFMGDNDAETFANIVRVDYDFEDEAFDAISQEAKDFMSNLLQKKKELRMSAKQCLSHSWLTQHTKNMSRIVLPTDKLKKFIVRRKWQKTGNALRALGRMAMLSANRRSPSLSPTSSQLLSGVARSEYLDSEDHHKYENIVKKTDNKYIERSITDSKIIIRENDISSKEEIMKNVVNLDSSIEKDFFASDKEITSEKTIKNIDEILDTDSTDVNFDFINELRQKKINHSDRIEMCNDGDDVPFNILNSCLSINNHTIINKDNNLDSKKIVLNDINKEIISEKQVDAIENKIIDKFKSNENGNEHSDYYKQHNLHKILNINYNNKSENTKIKNLPPFEFENMHRMKCNYFHESPNSKTTQKSNFLVKIDHCHLQDSRNSDKLKTQIYNNNDNIISANLKTNKNNVIDREVTRCDYRKFNTHFKVKPNEDSRVERSFTQGRLFIPTGNVSRTAKLFEKLETKHDGVLKASKITVTETATHAATYSTGMNAKLQSERIQRAFAFWNK